MDEAIAMKKRDERYARGKNPASLANLTGEGAGRHEKYGQPKKKREVSVTEDGWQGAKEVAKSYGCSGVSDLIEKLGRGELEISERSPGPEQ